MLNNNNISQELKDLGIHLPKATSPMPEAHNDYLIGLNESIQTGIFMETLPKEMPFQVPKGYLENFKVAKTHAKTILIFNYMKWAVAAAVIIFVAIGNLLPNKEFIQNTNSFASITNEAAMEYINANIDDFTEEELKASHVANNKIETILPNNLDDVKTSDLDEYILENNLNDI